MYGFIGRTGTKSKANPRRRKYSQEYYYCDKLTISVRNARILEINCYWICYDHHWSIRCQRVRVLWSDRFKMSSSLRLFRAESFGVLTPLVRNLRRSHFSNTRLRRLLSKGSWPLSKPLFIATDLNTKVRVDLFFCARTPVRSFQANVWYFWVERSAQRPSPFSMFLNKYEFFLIGFRSCFQIFLMLDYVQIQG